MKLAHQLEMVAFIEKGQKAAWVVASGGRIAIAQTITA